jgi:hypothetical protein
MTDREKRFKTIKHLFQALDPEVGVDGIKARFTRVDMTMLLGDAGKRWSTAATKDDLAQILLSMRHEQQYLSVLRDQVREHGSKNPLATCSPVFGPAGLEELEEMMGELELTEFDVDLVAADPTEWQVRFPELKENNTDCVMGKGDSLVAAVADAAFNLGYLVGAKQEKEANR